MALECASWYDRMSDLDSCIDNLPQTSGSDNGATTFGSAKRTRKKTRHRFVALAEGERESGDKARSIAMLQRQSKRQFKVETRRCDNKGGSARSRGTLLSFE